MKPPSPRPERRVPSGIAVGLAAAALLLALAHSAGDASGEGRDRPAPGPLGDSRRLLRLGWSAVTAPDLSAVLVHGDARDPETAP
ncbi:hypothetical protein AB0K43_14150 [Kitasatospora sp. NPDC049258]|uniref:hypothetical protein n=1 Tax=Kitasatospora sp. NPDC049258 TaxID=3155394 RepID=UPI00343ADE94